MVTHGRTNKKQCTLITTSQHQHNNYSYNPSYNYMITETLSFATENGIFNVSIFLLCVCNLFFLLGVLLKYL